MTRIYRDVVREFPIAPNGAPNTVLEILAKDPEIDAFMPKMTLDQMVYFQTWYNHKTRKAAANLPLTRDVLNRVMLPILQGQPLGRHRLERVGYTMSTCKDEGCACKVHPQLALIMAPVCFTTDEKHEVYWPFTMMQMCRRSLEKPLPQMTAAIDTAIESVFVNAPLTVRILYRKQVMKVEVLLLRAYFQDWLVFADVLPV